MMLKWRSVKEDASFADENIVCRVTRCYQRVQEIEPRHRACRPVGFNHDDDRTICGNSVSAARTSREKRSTNEFRRCRTSASMGIIEFRANLFDRGRDLLCALAFIIAFVSRVTHTDSFDSLRVHQSDAIRFARARVDHFVRAVFHCPAVFASRSGSGAGARGKERWAESVSWKRNIRPSNCQNQRRAWIRPWSGVSIGASDRSES